MVYHLTLLQQRQARMVTCYHTIQTVSAIHIIYYTVTVFHLQVIIVCPKQMLYYPSDINGRKCGCINTYLHPFLISHRSILAAALPL